MSNEFKYMMLNRLKLDCEYFLGCGNGIVKYLWAGDVKEQIDEMKKIWNELNDKPEWLSMDDILNYENKMINYKSN